MVSKEGRPEAFFKIKHPKLTFTAIICWNIIAFKTASKMKSLIKQNRFWRLDFVIAMIGY